MINTIEVKVVGNSIEVSCTECRTELDHVLRFVKSARTACPYCGQEITKEEIDNINKAKTASGVTTTFSCFESFTLPNGAN